MINNNLPQTPTIYRQIILGSTVFPVSLTKTRHYYQFDRIRHMHTFIYVVAFDLRVVSYYQASTTTIGVDDSCKIYLLWYIFVSL